MKSWLKFALSIGLTILLLASSVTLGKALDGQAPAITAYNPGSDAAVTTPDFIISFTVTDADDNIQDSNYYIKLDGAVIPSKLQYKGHMQWDYYDGDYWVIDSYRDATVSATVTEIKDCVHSVEVQAMDSSGNPVNQTWNFTVAAKPVFSNLTPPNQGSTTNNQGFSVKVTDNGTINQQSISAALDGTPVEVSFDEPTGLIAYQGSIPDGTHTAKVTAADSAGNRAEQVWNFTVRTTGPDMTFAGSGQTYKSSQVTVAVDLQSDVKILDSDTIMQIDRQTVAGQFTYKGHFISTYDGDFYVIDSYNQGRISFTAPSLSDGDHQLKVSAKDILGNTSSETWNFNVMQPPVFSDIKPVNGEIVNVKPVIKAVISDPNGSVDLNSISLLIDNTKVTPELVSSNGSVTLTYSANDLSNDSYHEVKLSAADTAGSSATTTWKFFACAIGTQGGFSRQQPADQSEVNSIPQISLHLTDLNKAYDINKLSLSIDNNTPVKPVVVGLDTEFYISYTPQNLTDGTHTVSVTVPGLTSETSAISTAWTFNVKVPPVITKPSPTYTVTTNSPVISAYASDNSGLAKAEFTIDGQAVGSSIDTGFNRVFVKSPWPLESGTHDVTLAVFDNSGNVATTQWNFEVDTNIGAVYPDMTVATNESCWQCHQNEYNFKHVPPKQCLSCHTEKLITLVEFRDCIGCHFDKTYQTNRHAWDSTWVWENLPNRRHPINDIHLSSTTECTECHSRILTKEHGRSQWKDNNGNPITCDTCHTDVYLASLDSERASQVKDAIATGNTGCRTCHEQAGHASIHEGSMEAKCLGCHNVNLQTEHMANDTTEGRGYTCNTCHASSRNVVIRAINNNQLICSSCHETAHNLPLTEIVPVDIPLYPGYTFTKPIEAAIFTGDQGLPAGFAANYQSGVVVFSNRKSVNVMDVWDFYNSELTQKGWLLKSSAPAASSDYFSAEFEKYGRLLTVRCFDTAFGDNSGPESSGYRIELWYR